MFDKDGVRAGRGRIHQPLVDELRTQPYFRRQPPKSTGREMFGAVFLNQVLARGMDLGVTG